MRAAPANHLRVRLVVPAVWALFCGGLATTAATPPPQATADDRYAEAVQPLLRKYCYGCHGNEKSRAELNLEAYRDAEAVVADRERWEGVMVNVSYHLMPPDHKPQPTIEERQTISSWIDSVLYRVDCNNPDPGRVTIRRLNRAEYNNTIRDLAGVDFHPADSFPSDDSGYGFDNIGDVLTLSPLLMEKYLVAADQVLGRAIRPVRTEPEVHRFAAAAFTVPDGARRDGETLVLYTRSEVKVAPNVPRDGEYIMRVRASATQAGDETARMVFRVGGREVHTTDVEAERSRPSGYQATVKLREGRQDIAVAFVNDYYDPRHPDPARRDRNLYVTALELEGPVNVAPAPPSRSEQLIFVRRPDPDAPEEDRDCARDIVANFARRAFRRPVGEDEVNRLIGLYDAARGEGDGFEAGIRLALKAVLVSPHFLFRGEIQPEPDNPKSVHPIGEYELAGRLSYFLWSSMPDEELFALAANGTLRTHLDDQVARMLGDPRSSALTENFAGQWLQIRDVKMMTPDPNLFPAFDDELRDAMYEETENFFRYVQEQDRSILDFITSNYTFLNDKLAGHYGIEHVAGPEFRRVVLKTPRRGGVLTHAGILTLTSNPTRTSPVKRGKWILDNILGTPPPPPPDDVPPLEESATDSSAMALRRQLEVHRENPVCASCHTLMDPIGLAFEHYDAVGAWREDDGGHAIDSSGRLRTGESFDEASELIEILAEEKRELFVRCVADRLLTYALGRGLEYYDRCALDDICEHAARNGYRFSSLVTAVVKSVPFLKRRGEAAGR